MPELEDGAFCIQRLVLVDMHQIQSRQAISCGSRESRQTSPAVSRLLYTCLEASRLLRDNNGDIQHQKCIHIDPPDFSTAGKLVRLRAYVFKCCHCSQTLL
ncbi:hypothetical protein LSAT2_014340 [Lamellibrachia satsuma]|nr:hypothetical protein LSAT2_014340 [Lamellibrachia satsuma]